MKRLGSIEQRPSGAYRARYFKNGKTYRREFPTEHAAQQWLHDEQQLIVLDIWTPPTEREEIKRKKENPLTVGQWLTQWFEIKRPTWKESTYDAHLRQVTNRILDVKGTGAFLATVPLAKLRRADIMRWWDAITTDYDTPATNRHALTRLSTALSDAVERELIDTNPAAHLRVPKPTPHRKELPETTTMMAIMDKLPDRHKIVAVLTFFHGLRIGEALGLRRMDVDIQRDRIQVHIRGNCYRKTGVGMIRQDKPKTDAAHRTVPIFPAFAEAIRHHLDTYVSAEPDAMVCVTDTGAITMDTSYRIILERAKIAAGYPDLEISPHYGRVWAITHLIEAGLTIPAIGEILGQRDLSTITETYMRTSDARKQEALNKMNDALTQIL